MSGQMSSTTELDKGSIGKLMVKLAIPSVIAQLINVLYSLVDRVYIGNMPETGKIALTGVGVTFPIIMIVSAFSAFVGMGGAPQAAIRMGEGDNEKAEKILSNGVTMLTLISIVLSTVLIIFRYPILMAFGASENTIGYAMDYLGIYLLGTLFVQFSIGLNPFISCQGFANTAMFSVVIGAIINIVLDPIFIFLFDMGVSGAALATIIAQFVSAVWVVRFLCSKKSKIRINIKKLKPDIKIIAMIAGLGVSPFVMQASESLVQIILNSSLQRYGGDMYVGAMTIILSVMQLFIMPIQGFTQGVTPITSYNFGAGNMDRVRAVFKRVLVISLSIMIAVWLGIQVFAGGITRIFTPDAGLIELTAKCMRINFGCIFMFGITMACQSTFLALGQAKLSLFLAMLRKIILLIPIALILPVFVGVMGIYYAQPIADFVSASVCLILFICNFGKILSNREKYLKQLKESADK